MAVLLLNATYEPLDIISVRRALSLLGRQRVSSATDQVIHARAPGQNFAIPSVLVLRRYVNAPRRGAKFSRRAVLQRDNYACAYCGQHKPVGELTLDHVIPLSRGGKTTWGNVVTACGPCNQRKANRTPHEAGMKLRFEPKMPRVDYLVVRGDVPVEWKVYLEL